MPITTTTAGAAISGLAGGGGGGLGTLVLRLIADSNNLVKGMADAEQSILTGAASITGAAVKMGLAVTSVFTGLGIVAVREFAKWESSFINMQKTIDGTERQLNQLAGAFRQMALEIPVNVNQINNVAAAAGQLGISRENIISFTKTMEQLGETTDLSAETAANQLARFANVTKMPQQAFDQLGASISLLDKASASSAKEIVDMALRIAGAGTSVGLTKTNILALAAAMSSVGIQAELGGSAIDQVMIRMSKAINQGGDELTTFAEMSGSTTKQFTEDFATNAAGAMLKFIQGTKKAVDSGKDVFGMLDKLHLDGVRVTEVLQALANSEDLEKFFGIAKKGWDENASLTTTAELRYRSFASQMQLTMNLFREMAIQIGEALAPTLLALNDVLQASLKAHMGLGSYIKDFLVDYAIPAVLAGVGMIGDAWNGLNIIYKTLQIVTVGFVEALTLAFTGMAKTVEGIFNFMINGIVIAINYAIKATNLLSGGLAKISEVPLMPHIDFSEVDAFNQGLDETRQDYQKELGEMTSATETFSDRVMKSYEKVGEHIKQVNKAVVADTKKTVADVAAVHLNAAAAEANQATSKIDKMFEKDMPGFTMGRGKHKRFTGLLGPGLGQFENKDETTAMQLRTEKDSAKERLKVLQDIDAQELNLSEETQKKKLALIEAYNAKTKALQMAEAQFVFQTAGKMFEDLSSIAETWGGKQSAAYQAMFAVSKAFAIADAIVKIQQGIAGAFSLPWPANLAAAASVVAATAGIVSNIAAVTLNLSGQRERGGPVGVGKAYLVGERGPELFVPSDNGNVIANDKLGGGAAKVIVNNYTDGHPEVRERQVGGEKFIEIAIRRAKAEIGSEVREGRGDVSRAFENTFNLRRGR